MSPCTTLGVTTLRRVLIAVALCLVVANIVALAARPSGSSASAVATPVTTTTVAVENPVVPRPPHERPKVAPAIVLPIPANAPDDPYADEPEIQLGRLQIPAIGLDTTLYEGVSLTSIDRGPSHWPGTAMPGQLGNVVVAGHRVTHSHPFRDLDDLGAGDVAIFTTPDGTFTYTYVSTEIVDPARVDIVNQTVAYTATFFACHPPGSARSRIVVRWQLEGQTAAATTPGAGTITVTNP